MPSAPRRQCPVPGCPEKVTNGRCSAHTIPGVPSNGWRQYPEGDRIQGPKLQALRRALWVQDPHCQACRRLLPPDEAIRDHIVNLAEGGTEDDSNTQILCEDCHRTKTIEERKRGIARTL